MALPDLRRPSVGPRRSRRTRRQGGEALRRDQKAEIIAELEARLRSTSTVLAADFRGLSVKELSELRGQLRNADAGLTAGLR